MIMRTTVALGLIFATTVYSQCTAIPPSINYTTTLDPNRLPYDDITPGSPAPPAGRVTMSQLKTWISQTARSSSAPGKTVGCTVFWSGQYDHPGTGNTTTLKSVIDHASRIAKSLGCRTLEIALQEITKAQANLYMPDGNIVDDFKRKNGITNDSDPRVVKLKGTIDLIWKQASTGLALGSIGWVGIVQGHLRLTQTYWEKVELPTLATRLTHRTQAEILTLIFNDLKARPNATQIVPPVASVPGFNPNHPPVTDAVTGITDYPWDYKCTTTSPNQGCPHLQRRYPDA